jgi:hypothetical protein
MQSASDNEVLEKFPRAVRERVLRALYYRTLQNVYLFDTPRIHNNPAFLSNLLSLGEIETYVPNVAVLEANSQVHDFMILLDGEIRVRGLLCCCFLT